MKFLLLIVLAFILLIPVSVFAQESTVSSITVKTDDKNYDEGDTIVISGKVNTTIPGVNVVLQIFTEGNMIEIVQITVAQDGTYSHTVLAEGPLWKKPGTYVVRSSYEVGGGTIAETEFNYLPNTTSIETKETFDVNAGSKGTFDVEYTIRGSIVKDIKINSNNFSLEVEIETTDDGSITLDLPREFIGAEKQDGKDDIFIILIDGIDVAYEESVVLSESRKITINFEEGDSKIEIIGTFIIGTKKSTTYPNPNGYFENSGPSINSDSVFRTVPEKPNVGASIRVTGDKFEASQELDFYIDTKKIGNFVTDENGHFMTTMKIPDEQNDGRVDFIISDSQDNEKSISLRIEKIESRILNPTSIPFTAEISTPSYSADIPLIPIPSTIIVSTDKNSYNHGDIISISGNIDNFEDNSISLYITDSENIKIWDEAVLIKDNGDFSTLVIAGGNNWAVNGAYILTATHYDYLARSFFLFELESEIEIPEPRKQVPEWIKNNAEWWSQGEINDDTFVSGIQYLMKEKIVDIPDLPEQASEKARPSFVDETKDPQSYVDRYNDETSYKEWFDENYPDYTIEEAVGVPQPIPAWIKNTAGWWAEGMITEDEFLKGIEFLTEKGFSKWIKWNF